MVDGALAREAADSKNAADEILRLKIEFGRINSRQKLCAGRGHEASDDNLDDDGDQTAEREGIQDHERPSTEVPSP